MIGFALSGRAGAGKTTMGGILSSVLREAGHHPVVCAFADPLKEEVYRLHGIRKTDVGGREALIRHGEKRRLEDPDHWIHLLTKELIRAKKYGCVPIVDDMRFQREFDWLKALGFVTIRMLASTEFRRGRLEQHGLDPEFAQAEVPSEVELLGTRHNHFVRNAWGKDLRPRAVTIVSSA